MEHHGRIIKLLHVSIDPDPSEDSEFRFLVDNQSVKYITISGGLFEPLDMSFEPDLVPQLPPFPHGDWNTARISADAVTGLPCFEAMEKRLLPGITNLWHDVRIDYAELRMGRRLKSNVYEATCARLGSETVVAKFARFPWEICHVAAETTAYEWIEGHGIGPAFLGHLTEEGRVIGFVMARVGGGGEGPESGFRHAQEDDLPLCQSSLGRLHALGIRHGDTNKHNFLVHHDRVTMIDFDVASRPASAEELEQEMQRLLDQLRDTSGRGGVYSVA
ncbi:hypothetical protein MAPG_10914 [Magnaporthiopsis poae ATCC 64411]|uniref:Alpha-galactosidase A n=1 Tax=Magnaporthiopsis poae (strain ATCC 64411 / 73-15) TaxID=644358 RepID=A0A0C4EDV3_MAGP6|nr:hypothetical protein MAPG_10914 [Magnaporthiopsis poae ATCC 64411]